LKKATLKGGRLTEQYRLFHFTANRRGFSQLGGNDTAKRHIKNELFGLHFGQSLDSSKAFAVFHKVELVELREQTTNKTNNKMRETNNEQREGEKTKDET
jgi:hypothetical protein